MTSSIALVCYFFKDLVFYDDCKGISAGICLFLYLLTFVNEDSSLKSLSKRHL